MNGDAAPLPLFSACGIELEYMIVGRDTLDVLPACDRLLEAAAGDIVTDFEDGPIAWSNELVLHVVEIKTNGPAASLDGLPQAFQSGVDRINSLLDGLGGRLMPGAMHPWMNPLLETRLWPHDHNEVYAAFNRIFDCSGHGWSNLQSMHINLPFANDAEFAQLHAAIRLLLPLLPALAASSPLRQWDYTGLMDTRLDCYRRNAAAIPSITGQVVPEPATSRADYERTILAPMYADIAAHDPDGVLAHEWLNARGAIARFERNTIEIRVLDTQEAPRQDLAVAGAVVAVLRELVQQRWSDGAAQSRPATGALAHMLERAVREAELAVIDDTGYLRLFGFPDRRAEMRELWQHLAESVPGGGWRAGFDFILRHGCLARRMARAIGPEARRARVRETARVLCECLARGACFEGID